MYSIRNNELEIISLFRIDYKARFYLREISRSLKIPLKTCQNILSYLEKTKILKSKIEGKNKYFFLNLENIRTKFYLLRSEIYKTDLFIETYPRFKMFLKSLRTEKPLILFGSFAKSKQDKNSDIDMLIVAENEQGFPFHLLPYKPHKVMISKETFMEELREKQDLIKEIEENHIILNNHSFYIDMMWGHYEK